jgi:hypothetical protein
MVNGQHQRALTVWENCFIAEVGTTYLDPWILGSGRW